MSIPLSHRHLSTPTTTGLHSNKLHILSHKCVLCEIGSFSHVKLVNFTKQTTLCQSLISLPPVHPYHYSPPLTRPAYIVPHVCYLSNKLPFYHIKLVKFTKQTKLMSSPLSHHHASTLTATFWHKTAYIIPQVCYLWNNLLFHHIKGVNLTKQTTLM